MQIKEEMVEENTWLLSFNILFYFCFLIPLAIISYIEFEWSKNKWMHKNWENNNCCGKYLEDRLKLARSCLASIISRRSLSLTILNQNQSLRKKSMLKRRNLYQLKNVLKRHKFSIQTCLNRKDKFFIPLIWFQSEKTS